MWCDTTKLYIYIRLQYIYTMSLKAKYHKTLVLHRVCIYYIFETGVVVLAKWRSIAEKRRSREHHRVLKELFKCCGNNIHNTDKVYCHSILNISAVEEQVEMKLLIDF